MKNFSRSSIVIFLLFLICSSNIFSQWSSQTSGVTTRIRYLKAVDDSLVWACGVAGVVLKTTDGGTNWIQLTKTNEGFDNYSVEAIDENIAWVAGTVTGGSTDAKIWKTTDGGTSWVQQFDDPKGFSDGIKFFGENTGFFFGDPSPYPSTTWGMQTTTDGGTTWVSVPDSNYPAVDLANGEYGCAGSIEALGTTIWFGAYSSVMGTQSRVFKSTDMGYNWTVSSFSLVKGASAANFIAFTDSMNGVDVCLDGTVAMTSDGGSTWTTTSVTDAAFRQVTSIPNLSNAYVTVGNKGISYYSIDKGETWTSLATNVTVDLFAIDASQNYFWAAGNGGTILKLDRAFLPNTAPWIQQSSGTTIKIRCIKAIDDNIVWACGPSGLVIKTIDGGDNWIQKTAPDANFNNFYVDALDSTTAWVTGASVFSGIDGRVWKTTDGGSTWVQQFSDATGFGDGVKFFDADNGFFFGDPSPYPSKTWGIYTTSDGGANWTKVPDTNYPEVDLANGEYGCAGSIDVVGNTVWFGAYSGITGTQPRIYKSTDMGYNWTVSSFPQVKNASTAHFMSFADTANGVDVCLDGTIALTSDGGSTWTTTSIADAAFRQITTIPGVSNGYVAIGNKGISYFSTNGGTSWTSLTTDVTLDLWSLDASDNYFWAGGTSGVLIRADRSFLSVTDIKEEPSVINNFVLMQNYPNPFNPSTKIGYVLEERAHAKVKIFNCIGQEVATIVNEEQDAGYHQITFNASGLSSGVYFYRLETGDFTKTMKMILLK